MRQVPFSHGLAKLLLITLAICDDSGNLQSLFRAFAQRSGSVGIALDWGLKGCWFVPLRGRVAVLCP